MKTPTTYTVFVEPTFTGSAGYTSIAYRTFRSALRFAMDAANVWSYTAPTGQPATLAIITISAS